MEWLSACPMSLGALCGICVLGLVAGREAKGLPVFRS